MVELFDEVHTKAFVPEKQVAYAQDTYFLSLHKKRRGPEAALRLPPDGKS
ncbi:hypothetical protein GF1_18070 [Desulfolithobacter dissulfuricans]|uniref:Uncharacterized protein n=1 Tax=Desulfolithobacter dissulfuricans TaxID=2795293 RepID=A0A915XLA4_9BACT|nr:hypothetical protein GF1_18070 [Desulfolithobacter dissulfuricans]